MGAQQFQRIGAPRGVLLQSLGVVEIPVDAAGLLLLLLLLVGLRLPLLVGLRGRGGGGRDVCREWWWW